MTTVSCAPPAPATAPPDIPVPACLTELFVDQSDALARSDAPALAPREQLDAQHETLLPIYNAVRASGTPNYRGARIPLPHGLRMETWREYFPHDVALCDFLEFGFPANYCAPHPPTPTFTHHNSALLHAAHVDHYIDTERSHNALVGPFSAAPFTWIQTSPLMTREKRGSPHRRVILNLSAPTGQSVNAGIPRDCYLGAPFKLSLPTANSLKTQIIEAGRGCFLWSRDLSRGYRQLRTDPLDWPLLGIRWRGSYYFDCAIPFGLRFGAKCMHETTSAVTTLLNREGFPSLCYIDDIAGAHADANTAQHGFTRAQQLLDDLGLREADEKATPPSTSMTWLGVHFDTVAMTMSIPDTKIEECLQITNSWINKTRCTTSQLRSILGKLFHISQCSHTLRLFVNRLLDLLRSAPEQGVINIDNEARADIAWINTFLPQYNGIQLITPTPSLDIPLIVDSCLTGAGAHFGKLAYHCAYPAHIKDMNLHITQLEMLNTMAAIRLWAQHMAGHTLLVRCDNEAAVSVLQTGRGRDKILLQCARIIWIYTARHKVTIQVRHIAAADNQLADDLSRYHLHQSHRARINALAAQGKIQLCTLPTNVFSLLA